MLATALLALAACGSGNDPSLTAEPPADSAPAAAEPAPASPEAIDLTVTLPPIPPVVLPDVSELTQTGDVVAEQLGDLVSPVTGVDLLTASCPAATGQLVYQGTTGNDDVFAIDTDGSGHYERTTAQGLTTLDVAADGSGVWYDKAGPKLSTITVQPDGAGEYYREEPKGTVTLDVAADGSGAYTDNRGRGPNAATSDATYTVTLAPDGTGQLYDKTADGLLTVDARPDGTGEYYHKLTTGPLTTVEVFADGGWKLTEVTTAQLLEVSVAADGSGTYRQSGLHPVEVAFDPQGHGLAPAEGSTVALPPAPPSFSVAGRFPPLGKLGALSPPCATVLRFQQELLFEFGHAELRPEAGPVLDQVVAALNQAGKPVEINGHTDDKGSDESNLKLSQERAAAVDAALKARGLTVATTVTGYGETQPIAPNGSPDGADDPAGRAQNRRVEIVIPEPDATPAPTPVG